MSHFNSIPTMPPGMTARALVLGVQARTLQNNASGDPAPFALPDAPAKAHSRGVARVPAVSETIVVHVPPQKATTQPLPTTLPANPPTFPAPVETDISPSARPDTPLAPDAPDAPPPVNLPPPPPVRPEPAAAQRPGTVQQAIASAAEKTSIDYNYLIAQAELESGLNPRAKARTSSATGLFQFLDNTWLGTLKRHGARFGLGPIADEIQIGAGGRVHVPDQGQRNAILALRNDPRIASLMAAGLAEDNRAALEPVLGRAPDHGELYLAHFLGAGGARQFLTELQRNPGQSAAAVFPLPAAANRAIFYDRDGSPRSLDGVMDLIDAKMRGALARVGEPGMIARANAPIGPQALTAPAFSVDAPTGYARGADAGGGFTPLAYTPVGEAALRPGATRAFAPAPGGGAVLEGVLVSDGPTMAPVAPRISMSAMLRATFGGDGAPALASPEGAAQVRRAYAQLQAFGL
jgi:hypothetical protein